MPKYELSNAADDDLTEIYTYSFTQFGENQADAYFESLEECLFRVSENPEMGLDVSAVRKGYRRFSHKRHSIYYQTARSAVLVTRILGPGMSIEKQISN